MVTFCQGITKKGLKCKNVATKYCHIHKPKVEAQGLNKGIEKKNKVIAKLKLKISDLEDSIDELKSDKNELVDQIDELQQSNSDLLQIISDLKVKTNRYDVIMEYEFLKRIDTNAAASLQKVRNKFAHTFDLLNR